MKYMTEKQIEEARAAVPALHKMLHLNTGTKGLTAQPVIDALVRLTKQLEETEGYAGLSAVQAESLTARARLATFLGCDDSELAFTGNATESLNIALSVRWDAWGTSNNGPVDVLISDHEYPTTNMLFGYLSQIGKVNLIRFSLSEDMQKMLESLEQNFTSNTRLVVASHVDCNTGLRIDAKALCDWCRTKNIISYIDGAQAVGQFPINLHEMGCDLYISNGHKWLFGPNGVGLLYIKSGLETSLTPLCVGTGTMHFDPNGVYEGDPKWAHGAQRFELLATRPAQVFATMHAALDWYEHFGEGAIEARQRELTAQIKARLLEMPDRFRLITPLAWEEASALASFQIIGVSGAQILDFCSAQLTQKRAFIRAVPEFDAIRLSMAYYNTPEEYEILWEMLEGI
jgi:selenocysteine lyase/cysteine desulfurase